MDFSEVWANIRAFFSETRDTAAYVARTYRPWLLGGATILSILVIVWARFGFSLQISQFFAAGTAPAGTVEIWSAAPGGGIYEFDSQKPGCFGTVVCPNQPAKCNRLGSLAYGIRTGGAKYDTEHNLLFSENPANVNDYRTWQWADVPTSEADWCNRTDGFAGDWFSQHKASPPADGSTFWGHISRCIDGSRGFVPLACSKIIGGGSATPTPSPTPLGTPDVNAPAAGTIAGFCSGGATPSITLRWSKLPPPGSQTPDSNGMNKRVDGVTTQMEELIPVDKGAYWEFIDTRVSANKEYSYWAKYRPDTRTTNTLVLTTNLATCSGGSVPTPTPTPALTTPTPAATTLVCAPTQQAAAVGQSVEVSASGGNIVDPTAGAVLYSWSVSPDGTVTSPTAGAARVSIIFQAPGEKQVRVSVGTQSATCAVSVQQPGGFLSTVIAGRNVSANSSFASATNLSAQQIGEVRITLTLTQGSAIPNATIRALLADGLSYVAGSTIVNGTAVSVDAVTAGGLNIGTLQPQVPQMIVFRVRAPASSQMAIGTTPALVTAQLLSGAQSAGPSVTTTFNLVRSGGSVGQVQTGPGDATVLALIVSSLVALLYVSYTHSPAFRARQAKQIADDKDPMDFRT